MSTSIIGIILSVSMSFFNTLFSPEKVFLDSVEKFENTLDTLWNCSDSGPIPAGFEHFDEHRDPVYALAESALSREINNSKYAKAIAKEKANSQAKEEHAIYIHSREQGTLSTPNREIIDKKEAS